MTREEFEKKYAMKYRNLDFIHNPSMTLFELEQNRNGDGYHDHHLDLCWKVQKIKNVYLSGDYFICIEDKINDLEW